MTQHQVFQRLRLNVPVFQAPIGSIATPQLAAAVSQAGGLGQLACTWKTPQQLQELLRMTRELTSLPFGVTFVLDFDIDELLDIALSQRVAAVSFFGATAAPTSSG